MLSAEPYAPLKRRLIRGKSMAYIDEGEGDAIVFQHGNPTSSYLWRNVMPHVEGLGRLVACDLIGMGGSDKLTPSGPDRYHYAEHRDYLFDLWDELELGDEVILVVHDWGSALGFDWALHHPDRVQGIVHMESIAAMMDWSEFPEQARRGFQGFRSPAGEQMVLRDNLFVEQILINGISRELSNVEKAHYRQPFLHPGEDRRPMLSWPRDIPISGEPAAMATLVREYGQWLAGNPIPKLFVNGEPGGTVTGRVRAFVRTWPNQTEVTVSGVHYLQEEHPHEIGAAIADFVRTLRGSDRDGM